MKDTISEVIQIEPKINDIGDFSVRRFLPSLKKRSVGPFIFFDEMGPALLEDGKGMNVRPHPHIGLSTLTWMIEGEIVHRDSLGYTQTIRPGEVNWMTSGRGIVHSERSPEHMVEGLSSLYGLQIWMALPSDKQEIEPEFQHVKADEIPKIKEDGREIKVIAGEAYGLKSPVKVQSPTIYLDVTLDGKQDFDVPFDYEEQAIFILDGIMTIGGHEYQKGDFLVLSTEHATKISIENNVHFVLLGGKRLENRRHLWWNFVSTSKERLEQAKSDWKEGKFDKVVDDEEEFIPLPEG